METVKVSKNDVLPIVRATFPDYRGRKITIMPTERVCLQDINWSGGSRNQYRACTIDGYPLGNADRFNAMHPADHQAEGAIVPLVPGACLVEHCIFCGKDLGLRIHIHPSDMPRLLPAPRP